MLVRRASLLVACVLAVGCREEAKLEGDAEKREAAPPEEVLPAKVSEARPEEEQRVDPPASDVLRSVQVLLASRYLEQSLRAKPPTNVRFSPLALQALLEQGDGALAAWISAAVGGPSSGAIVGKQPSRKSITISAKAAVVDATFNLELARTARYEKRTFMGLSGTTGPGGLQYFNGRLPHATHAAKAGPYEVFELPLRDSTLELRYVELPRAKAERIAQDLAKGELLEQLLSLELTEFRGLIMARGPVESREPIKERLQALTSEPVPAKVPTSMGFKWTVGFTGPITAERRLLNENRLARPGWMLLSDKASGELLAVVGLHAPEP